MPDHIKIAASILILFFGLGMIFYLINIKNKYRDYSLKWLLYYITAYNFAIFTGLMRKYVDTNLSSIIRLPFPFEEFDNNFQLILNFIRIVSITVFIGYLTETDISRTAKRILVILVPAILIMIGLKFSFYEYKPINEFVTVTDEWLSQLFFYYEPFMLILLFIRYIRKDRSLHKSLNISFSILFIMRYIFFLVFYVIPINILGYYDKFMQAFLIMSSIFVFNIMPFFWLKYFYVKYQSSAPEVKPGENDLVFEKHGITSREREIIKLILEGKTNKEIEAELFLSGHTVKNHIYHIYQKFKINSRFQLIKLFRE